MFVDFRINGMLFCAFYFSVTKQFEIEMKNRTTKVFSNFDEMYNYLIINRELVQSLRG